MSAIAKVMFEMGYHITGSDVAMHELSHKLQKNGVKVDIGHKSEHIDGADLVVYSTALAPDNVELIAAKERNISVLHRSQMLARLMSHYKGIAVAGAHGKTTTSSMIAYVMVTCQHDPTFIIGGEVMDLGSNARAGKGPYLIAEADESDGSFLHYMPYIAVVNNIEADHLENYQGSFEQLQQAYAQFMNQVTPEGRSVVCIDDPVIQSLIPHIHGNVVTYGIDHPADVRAVNIQLGDRKVTFTVQHQGIELGLVHLSVPGKHNIYNALATIVTCMEIGLTFEQVATTIAHFKGAKRRFQVLADVAGHLVIDDYAHHPTEIEATLQAAKASGMNIIAVFQPQRYSRTFYLFEEFSRAFRDADQVIITDIYSPAGEQKIEGVHAAKLVESIREHSNPHVLYVPTGEEALALLIVSIKPGDLVITMGAGDIWKTGEALAAHLLRQ